MVNNLLNTHPDLCKEWDYEKNIIKPDEITFGIGKKIYWKCNNGHSYRSPISRRTIQKSGCPYCSGRLPIKGFNDLLSNFSDICKEWDYELNTIKPDEITSYSHKKVYWKCNNNHSWLAMIALRTGQNSGCPICSKEMKTKHENGRIITSTIIQINSDQS